MSESDTGATVAAGEASSVSTSSSHRELSEKYLHYGEQSVAILISDMEGFTQTTRRLGIVHFASMVRRTSVQRHGIHSSFPFS
jgi:class 3 adenylate cyclase